jgi:tetratricopeptide (TPR) repeat protein
MQKIVAGVAVTLAVTLVVALKQWGSNDPPDSERRFRRNSARLVGDEHAPRRVMRGGSPEGSEPDPLRESKIREAAKSETPAALSNLAAVLVNEADRFDQTSALQAVSVASRAIADEPDLAPAHFNRALALEQLGLTHHAHAEFLRAAELDGTSGWAKEARSRAAEFVERELSCDREAIERSVALMSDPVARNVLRPYLAEPVPNGRRSRQPADVKARLSRAASTYKKGMDTLTERVARRMEMLYAGAEPCAYRYSMAGALHAAGMTKEAVTWLASVDGDVFHTRGRAGLAAQLVWEEGLSLVARGTSSLDALALFEAERERSLEVGQPSLAAMFGTLAGDVRAHHVKYALAGGDTAAAFRLADGGSSLDVVQAALAPKAAILRYVTLDNEVVVFVVRRESVEGVRLLTTGPDMAHAAEADLSSAASQLYALVIAPLSERLDGISTIAVVPNRELTGVPFGALFDTGRGEYLTQRFTIVHATSASATVEQSRRAKETRDSTLLAIGATELDHERNPRVDVLPGAGREVSDIAAISPCARVFSGSRATPEAIQRALAENAVIHYAGHIVQRGVSVRLLLAPSKGRDSFSSAEIAAFRLQKPRVVVLAGCRGASADSLSVMPTMAEAFLAAGVPTVIASSYDVDDTDAPATMRRLHLFLQNGEDAAEALRKTTLAEIQAGRGFPVSLRFHAIGGTRSLIQ